MTSKDHQSLPYEEAIADLSGQLDAARKRVAEIERKLAWWREGKELYDSQGSEAPSIEGKPVLAEAIIRVMMQRSLSEWSIDDIAGELDRHGWMPNGASAMHAIRGKLSDLAGEGHLVRAGRGIYILPVEEP